MRSHCSSSRRSKRAATNQYSCFATSYVTLFDTPSDAQKDIKSPIQIAQMKQADKLKVEPSAAILPQLKTAQDQAASPTKVNALQPTRRNEDGQTPAGGAFPELPSPGLPIEGGSATIPKTASRTLKDKEGNTQSVSYAVSIYP